MINNKVEYIITVKFRGCKMIKEGSLTEGNLFRSILTMSIPSMVGMIFEMLYEIVDMAWVARLSINAVAAITIFATVWWILDIVNSVIGTSSVTLIARYFGSGDKEKTVEVIEQTIIFKFILALVTGVIVGIVIPYVLKPLSNNNEVLQMSTIYGRIRLLTLPLAFSSYTVNTALRCIGDARKPLYLMMFTALMNAVLDPIMIFEVIPFTNLRGMGLGIAGAAYATVISQLLSFLLGLYILMSGKTFVKVGFKKGIYFTRDIDAKLITIGLPSGIESFFRNLAAFAIMRFITIYGVVAVAAYGICLRVVQLVVMPIFGLEMGTSVVVGQCIGCEKTERAEKAVYLSAKVSFVIMAAAGIVLTLMPELIMSFFTDKKDVTATGVTFLRYFSVAALFAGPSGALGAALFGAGENIPNMIAGVTTIWFVQIPLMYLFVNIYKLPINWVWITYIIQYILQFLIILYYVKKGDWKYKSV